jgi:hypothetical protein
LAEEDMAVRRWGALPGIVGDFLLGKEPKIEAIGVYSRCKSTKGRPDSRFILALSDPPIPPEALRGARGWKECE